MIRYAEFSPPAQASQNTADVHTGVRRWAVSSGIVLALTALYSIVQWHVYPAAKTDIGADYAYVSWQMSRGAVLYRDVLGQQTPLLYVLGAALYHLWPRPDVFLATALAIRGATVLAILALAGACRFSSLRAMAASLIYLVLPMGFIFGAHFEPNVLISLGGVLCTLVLARLSTRRAVLAGLGCGMFILVKLTFAPIALMLGVYLLITRRSLLFPFLLAAASALLGATVVGWAGLGQDYIDGAYLAHVGSTLSIQNLAISARYVWTVEGVALFAAFMGVLAGGTGARRDVEHSPRRLLACYLVGGLATLGATVSVGSLAPEMLAGEPAVALCAALVLTGLRLRTSAGARITLLSLMTMLLLVGQALEVRDDALTLAAARPSSDLACMVRLLRHTGRATQPVIAPAYAAFLAQRQVVDGLSDVFNWSIRVRRGDHRSLTQEANVVYLLRRKQIAVVAVNADHPLPLRVMRAVSATYVATSACPGLQVFLP